MTYDESRAAQLRAGNLLLPDDEHRREKQYVMPSPDFGVAAYSSLRQRAWPPVRDAEMLGTVTVSRDDLRRVLALADGYLTLTTNELGQECAVGKLRDIWRARRRAR